MLPMLLVRHDGIYDVPASGLFFREFRMVMMKSLNFSKRIVLDENVDSRALINRYVIDVLKIGK